MSHTKIRQVLHVITITGFIISLFFQLRNLYLYGGKPSQSKITSDEDNVNDVPDVPDVTDSKNVVKSSQKIKDIEYSES